MIATKVIPPPCIQETMQAHPDEELEHLKELLAEAEEQCLMLALEKHLEAQRAFQETQMLSKELEEMKERQLEKASAQPER
jgi:hypothetical protein